jgi:hypothetical protein
MPHMGGEITVFCVVPDGKETGEKFLLRLHPDLHENLHERAAAVPVERSTVDVDDTGIEEGSSGVVTAVEVAQLTVGNAGIDNGSSGGVAGGDVGAGSTVPGESKR